MPITTETLALQSWLDRQVQQVTDGHTRTLTAAWVRAWSEVSSDLAATLEELYAQAKGGTVSRTLLLRSVRLRQALAQVADRLDTLATGAQVTITSDLRQVVKQAARSQADILASQTPSIRDAAALRDQIHRTALPDRALDTIVKRTTEQVTSLTRPLAPTAYDAVRRELVRGVAVGDNPKQIAARMVKRGEGKFNGGLTRALVISRTEVLDAHRAAAEAEQNEQAHALTGWVWLCHLGPRTCPSCLAQNGSVHPLSEPGPLDHQQGRCSRMPKTKSWADLGFEGLDEPDDAVPDARAWFDSQPEAVQLQILGRERLDLINSGAISWDDLTQERPADGWRTSYGVTPVKLLRRRTNAA